MFDISLYPYFSHSSEISVQTTGNATVTEQMNGWHIVASSTREFKLDSHVLYFSSIKPERLFNMYIFSTFNHSCRARDPVRRQRIISSARSTNMTSGNGARLPTSKIVTGFRDGRLTTMRSMSPPRHDHCCVPAVPRSRLMRVLNNRNNNQNEIPLLQSTIS